MSAYALLLSQDKEVQSILPRLLGGMRIDTEIATDVLRAARLLRERKFEAIIIDCELNGADTLLENIDSYPSNRTAVLFAIMPEVDTRDSLPAGAKFMIVKPVLAEQARRMLYAASGLLIHEYRRYFRCGLEVPIYLAAESRELRAKTTNISIGGWRFGHCRKFVSLRDFVSSSYCPMPLGSRPMQKWFGPTLKDELDCDSWNCRN